MDTCPILEEKYDKTEEKGCQWERRELATGPRGPNQRLQRWCRGAPADPTLQRRTTNRLESPLRKRE